MTGKLICNTFNAANGEILADGTYHILNENIQQKDRYLRLPPKDFDG